MSSQKSLYAHANGSTRIDAFSSWWEASRSQWGWSYTSRSPRILWSRSPIVSLLLNSTQVVILWRIIELAIIDCMCQFWIWSRNALPELQRWSSRILKYSFCSSWIQGTCRTKMPKRPCHSTTDTLDIIAVGSQGRWRGISCEHCDKNFTQQRETVTCYLVRKYTECNHTWRQPKRRWAWNIMYIEIIGPKRAKCYFTGVVIQQISKFCQGLGKLSSLRIVLQTSIVYDSTDSIFECSLRQRCVNRICVFLRDW